MREIKFRGLNAINEWVYGCLITNEYPNHEKCTQIYNNTGFNVVLKESVGEYTGLKNIEGVDIWEGDLFSAGLGNLYKVAWNNEAAKFSTVIIRTSGKMIGIPKLSMQEVAKLEIIGNIYQNPELLAHK